MDKPLVVMLGHKAHVGKDTLGEFLVKHDNFTRLGFADKLKSTVADLYGFTKEQMFTDLKNVVDERYGITPRVILQDFGQEQRLRDPDIWAKYVFRQIEEDFTLNQRTLNFHPRYVITDFRFPNENTVANFYSKKLDFKLITVKINRPDEERGDFAGSTNISETALDNFNFNLELLNSIARGKEDLYNRFKAFAMPSGGPTQTIKIDISTFV